MQSEYFWPDTQAASWVALSRHVFRLRWNPAAFRGSEGERAQVGLGTGSADNFSRVSVCTLRLAVHWPRKKFQMPRNLCLLGIFLRASISGEVMRTAENTTNSFPYFLWHTGAYCQLLIHSTSRFTATVHYLDPTARPVISSLKCFVGESVTWPEILLCWEEMVSETL